MQHLERDAVVEVTKTKAVIDSLLFSGVPSKDTLQLALDAYSQYIELTLPYIKKKDTISKEELNPSNIENWKAIIAAKKADLKKKVDKL